MGATGTSMPETRPGASHVFTRMLKGRLARRLGVLSIALAIPVLYGVFWCGLTFWLLLIVPIMCLVLALSLAILHGAAVATRVWLSAALNTPERKEKLLRISVLAVLVAAWVAGMYWLMGSVGESP